MQAASLMTFALKSTHTHNFLLELPGPYHYSLLALAAPSHSGSEVVKPVDATRGDSGVKGVDFRGAMLLQQILLNRLLNIVI